MRSSIHVPGSHHPLTIDTSQPVSRSQRGVTATRRHLRMNKIFANRHSTSIKEPQNIITYIRVQCLHMYVGTPLKLPRVQSTQLRQTIHKKRRRSCVGLGLCTRTRQSPSQIRLAKFIDVHRYVPVHCLLDIQGISMSMKRGGTRGVNYSRTINNICERHLSSHCLPVAHHGQAHTAGSWNAARVRMQNSGTLPRK